MSVPQNERGASADTALNSLPLPPPDQLNCAIQSLDIMAKLLAESGLEAPAIAQWRLNSLIHIFPNFPALAKVVEEAKIAVGITQLTEAGRSVTDVATQLSETLERKIKPEQVNKALVALGLQTYLEEQRVWQLTEAGKRHGQSFLATSRTNKWSGSRTTWNDSVIPLLEEYLQSSAESEVELELKLESEAPTQILKPSRAKAASKNGAVPKPETWSISERLKALKQKVSADQMMHIGMEAAAAYAEKHGTIPSKELRNNKHQDIYL